MPQKDYNKQLQQQGCCVILPTFNNEKTLATVIEDVLQYTLDIIVVNDGSTDATAKILKEYPLLKVINLKKNKGKGEALKMGFKLAENLGFQYALTIDTDGQHYADDIPVFANILENKNPEEEILLIGSRKMDHHTVPGKSNVGNKFSTFWYWVETGVKLTDTQCGFRLYPLKLINNLNLKSGRFELEIEVIVKAAWAGAKVKNVPVKVLYDKEERVTHFKPWYDTARITYINAKFVFLRVAQIFSKPKNRKKI